MGFETITPEPIKSKVMIDELIKLVEDEIVFADKQFELTYKSWEHKPTFNQEVKQDKSKIVGTVLTSDQGSTDNPYPFITKGTSKRFATMTSDFSPKSTPRVIGSRAGSGGVLYVDKRRPRSGIKAREYEPEIAKREQPRFRKRGEKVMEKIRKKSGHAI